MKTKIHLTKKELDVLDDYSDVSILEQIKSMSLEEMKIYDSYRPKSMIDYFRPCYSI